MNMELPPQPNNIEAEKSLEEESKDFSKKENNAFQKFFKTIIEAVGREKAEIHFTSEKLLEKAFKEAGK